MLFVICLVCPDAYAQISQCQMSNGPNGVQLGGTNAIATNFVTCVDQSIRQATIAMVDPVSAYMAPVVSAFSVYAIAMQGIKVFGGEGEFNAVMAGFLVRIAAVNAFFYDMGGLASLPFDLMDELSNVVAGWTPWGSIDDLIGHLFGFDATDGNNRQLFHGVLAMVSASVFSGTPGIMMGASGAIALFELMLFVLDVVYVYLLAVLLIAMCVIVSPLIIPLALFKYSERMFNKWLNAMIGAILIPAFLFGFLNYTVNIFVSQIATIIQSIDTNQNGAQDSTYSADGYGPAPIYAPYARRDQTLFSWLQRTDIGYVNNIVQVEQGAIGGSVSSTPSVSTTIDPKSPYAASSALMNYWGINLNSQYCDNDQCLEAILQAFLSLWIYTSCIIGMIKKIPGVAQEIAGSTSGISIQEKSFSHRASEIKQDLKMGGGALIGGFSAMKLADGAGLSPKNREATAVAGVIAGALVGRRIK